MVDVGERVGVVFSINDDEAKLIGYGKYIGREVPPEFVGGLAKTLRENNITDPKIKLDDGNIVYGCECWWGYEEELKRKLKKHKNVINVDINNIRMEYTNSQ